MRIIIWARQLMPLFPLSFILLGARVAMWNVFWFSGRTKVDGWAFWRPTDSAVALFADEYRLPLLPPEVAAVMASSFEHIFAVLLLVGLFTRWAAMFLLAMVAVIAVFVYPSHWGEHLLWVVCLLLLVTRGGGRFSLSHWLRWAD